MMNMEMSKKLNFNFEIPHSIYPRMITYYIETRKCTYGKTKNMSGKPAFMRIQYMKYAYNTYVCTK